jgi:putative ABC transport system permease protein
MIWESRAGAGRDTIPVAPGNFFEWRAKTSVFDDVGWSSDQIFNLTGDGDPENLTAYRFSPNFLSVMGVQPALGRGFRPEEGRPGSDRVVILSDALWRRRFGADPRVLGRHLTLNGNDYEVIGVMPPSFHHRADTQIWAPLALSAATQTRRDITALRLVGRLKPHVSIADAQRELSVVYASMAQAYPATNQGLGVKVESLRDTVIGDARTPLLVLLGAVGFVLLIACANVANLLVARAVSRQKELAIRIALGAGRARVLRQVLIESCLLGLAGGTVGLVLAAWTVDGLVSMFPQTISNLSLPRITSVAIDSRVIAFTLVASVVAGFLFGVLPAIQASRPELSRWLKDGRGNSGGAGRSVRATLAIGEIAVSVLLLVGALLMVRSFARLQSADLGFAPDRVLSLRMILPGYRYQSPDQVRRFAEGVVARVAALPGVESAGLTNYLPLSGWWGTRNFRVEGKPVPPPDATPEGDFRVATPGYFSTMGIRVLRGRGFTDADSATSPSVVIINETLARQYWPGGDPVGQRMLVDVDNGTRAWEIIGVVADVKSFGVQEDTHPELFRPFAQEPSGLLGLVVRFNADPDAQTTMVRRAIWDVDKDQPVSHVLAMSTLAGEALAFQRVSTLLIGGFAVLALTLAAVGVYGVLAYLVTERRREIGIRLALGADRRSVLSLVVGRALFLALLGGLAGLVVAIGLSRVLRTMLYGVEPADPVSYSAAAILVTVVAILASLIPGWRATRVDPIVALREE